MFNRNASQATISALARFLLTRAQCPQKNDARLEPSHRFDAEHHLGAFDQPAARTFTRYRSTHLNGVRSFPQPVAEDKVRGKPEKFADHYSQAKLFFASQSPIEQAHIINAFRFELTRGQTNAVRERVVSMLANVDDALAPGVAAGLGIEVPEPMPLVLEMKKTGPQTPSPALSLFSRHGAGGVKTRRVALIHKALVAEGAIPRFVAPRLGAFKSADGQVLERRMQIQSTASSTRSPFTATGLASRCQSFARRWPRSATPRSKSGST